MKKVGVFSLHPDMMKKALHMPDDHEIVCVAWDAKTMTLEVYVEGPEMPERAEGDVVPRIYPFLTQATDPVTGVQNFGWKWGA